MSSVIEVKKLTKVYGRQGALCRALNNVSLSIEEAEFVSVMGPSGSGKTTLLNIISTIDKATNGEILLTGQNVDGLSQKEMAELRRDLIGFVFQDFSLLNNMIIRDNIALPLSLNGVGVEEIRNRMLELAGVFGIENQLDKYPYQLSGGQKQRAAVCRALISRPAILFADEPTGALDSKSAAELLACFRSTRDRYKTTLVMVTHDASAASYSDRVLFLKDGAISGRLEAGGNRDDFFKRILNMVAVLGGNGNERL